MSSVKRATVKELGLPWQPGGYAGFFVSKDRDGTFILHGKEAFLNGDLWISGSCVCIQIGEINEPIYSGLLYNTPWQQCCFEISEG